MSEQELKFRTVFFIKEDSDDSEPVVVEHNQSIHPTYKTFPDDLPEGWLVFNAPRPIYGHWTWTGDFRSGVFYAALDPDSGPASAVFIKRNHELDASLVRWVTMAEVRAAVIAYYQENTDYWPRLVEYYGEELEKAPDSHIRQTFLTQVDNDQTVIIDGETGGLL